MDKEFFTVWFSGFSEGLDQMSLHARSKFLSCCARKCADTGVLEKYKKHCEKVHGDRDEFYSRLQEIGGVRGEVLVTGKMYRIIFTECSCDLHFSCGVNTPKLCECSRQSIIYISKSVWGEDVSFKVICEETVLSGAPECRFQITFDDIAGDDANIVLEDVPLLND